MTGFQTKSILFNRARRSADISSLYLRWVETQYPSLKSPSLYMAGTRQCPLRCLNFNRTAKCSSQR